MVHCRKTVLVTGASGFLATWVVEALVDQGYYVRGTVRSKGKGDHQKDLFGDNFEYVIVRDIEEVILDTYLHRRSTTLTVASRSHSCCCEGDGFYTRQCAEIREDVKRVVITSSTAAISPLLGPDDPLKVYTERDWNFNSVPAVEKEGRKSDQAHKYRASKVQSKVTWNYIDKYKSEERGLRDILNMLGQIFGPVLHSVSSAVALNTSSSSVILSFFRNDPPNSEEDLVKPMGNWINVRDVGIVYTLALDNPVLGNKDAEAALKEGKGRLLVSAGEWRYQDVLDALVDAGIQLPSTTPRGTREAGKNVVHNEIMDSGRLRELVGMKMRSMAEVFGDSLKVSREKGWMA
ncbi:hypothetical protein M422DRAFT_241298 [Sphaerobolus stellatus SS14]|nr:hypothetical protein M422DRAFT_241298 [Sphaerobolus stellatus SS14]